MPGIAPGLLRIEDLGIGFTAQSGATLPILRNVDLAVDSGETLGLVGESGCGKSTLALAMMGYLKSGLRVLSGSVMFRDRDVLKLSTRELEQIRGAELALIPQNAGQALTPNLRIGAQIAEALKLHSSLAESDRPGRVIELLTRVRLPDPAALTNRYPHELSGGQQQRVAIAMELACEPDLLLLDEPTTGLDVTTQAHILGLLRELVAQSGTAMIYVSHDLGAIARVCDRVAVMYAGEIVLHGDAQQVLRQPLHPYARGLLASIPKLSEGRLPQSLDGQPPPPGGVSVGCGFVERCALAEARCRSERPELQLAASGQQVRCGLHRKISQLAPPATGQVSRQNDPADQPVVLALKDVSISYAKSRLFDRLRGHEPTAPATVDGISIAVRRGETVGLVGESGSGKSTILKAISGLLPVRSGSIIAAGGEALDNQCDRRSREQLRHIQLIFQNPDDSLNPRHTVAEILAQPLKLYFGLTGEALRQSSQGLLDRVRLGPHYLERLPGQLSGGEKQRVAIARAFAAEPDIVLCDEVTSALDVSVQAAVLNLLNELRNEEGTAYVFVSHDLAVVRALANRVAVLYQGRLCEIGPAEQVYRLPSHPYTEILLGAVLEPDPDQRPLLNSDGVVELAPPAAGCPFQRRCPRRLGALCDSETPPWQAVNPDHAIRCHIRHDELQSLQRNGG